MAAPSSGRLAGRVALTFGRAGSEPNGAKGEGPGAGRLGALGAAGRAVSAERGAGGGGAPALRPDWFPLSAAPGSFFDGAEGWAGGGTGPSAVFAGSPAFLGVRAGGASKRGSAAVRCTSSSSPSADIGSFLGNASVGSGACSAAGAEKPALRRTDGRGFGGNFVGGASLVCNEASRSRTTCNG